MAHTVRITPTLRSLSSRSSSASLRTTQWLAQHKTFQASEPCHNLDSSLAQHGSFTSTRNISYTSALWKKAGKSNLSHAKSDSSPPITKGSGQTATDEALDYSTIESRILDSIERLSHDLKQLRAGGRFNPDLLEGLRVTLGKSGSKDTFKLGDLAQVVPRGRIVNVIVSDKDYIKGVKAAIMASGHSLTPQDPSPDNPLTIPVPLPPPTGESRKAALDAAQKAMEKANSAVHDARAAHQKKIRKFQVDKSVRPDDLQKASKGMEEVVKRGNGEVKRIYEGAKKVLEQQ